MISLMTFRAEIVCFGIKVNLSSNAENKAWLSLNGAVVVVVVVVVVELGN